MTSNELVSSRVQKSYGLRDEAVPESSSAGPDAAGPSAGRQQTEQFVVGVLNDPVGLLPTPLGVEVLHEWQHRPMMCCAVFITLCRALQLRVVLLPYQAVMEPVRILSMVHL